MAAPTIPKPALGTQRAIYYGYWIIGAAFVAQFIAVGTQAYVGGVFLKPMTDEFGWSRAEFTYAQTVGRFIMAFTGFFAGAYIDRWGARPLMLIGVTVLGIALMLVAEINELWQWLVLRGVIFTLGAALIGNLVVNVTLSKWFVERRGRAIGFAAMGVSFAGVVMPLLTSAIVEEWGWRTGWRALAVLAWLLVYPIAMIMRRQPEDYGWHPDGKTDEEIAAGGGARAAADYANSFTRREALRTKTLYLVILAFGTGQVGIGVMLLHTIPFMTDAGFDQTTAALMVTVISIPALLSKPVWGELMDRFEPRYLASTGFVMTAVAMVIIVFAANAHLLALAIPGFLLLGAGWGGQIPLQETIWASYFGRRYLGAVRSVAMPFSLVLGASAPLITAVYFDRVGNYDGAFLGVGALWAMGAALMFAVRPPTRPGAMQDRALEAAG